MQVMLLAAGRSTRLGALGLALPKPLVPVCGHAPLTFGLALCRAAGLRDVVVNLHHHGATIRAALGSGDAFGVSLKYSDEPDLLGTGGGLVAARPLFSSEPVLVALPERASSALQSGSSAGVGASLATIAWRNPAASNAGCQLSIPRLIHGTSQRTLPGREGGLVAEGVKATRNADGTWTSTGEANDIPVSAENYWNRAAPGSTTAVGEEFVNDASYVAMREINLSYRLPQAWFGKTPFTGISLSLVGRNLFYFRRYTDGFAPEAASFNVGNTGLGYESASLPFTRQIGFNINIGL